MVDRVSACITIGGILSHDHLPEFLSLIADEELSLDWEGPAFTAAQLVSGRPLTLMDHEVALGQFIPLEDFCVARSLPFRRWSGGCASWGPQRAVFDGSGCVNYLTINDGGAVLIDRATLEHLGTMEEVLAWFEAADCEVPPLVIATRQAGARLLFLVKVDTIVCPGELEPDDRAVPGRYAIALDPASIARHPDSAGFIELAKDIFHDAIPIGNLDDFIIEVSIVGSEHDLPGDVEWLTQASSTLPTWADKGGRQHG